MAKPTSTDPAFDRGAGSFSTRSGIVLCMVAVFILIVGWVVTDLLTARPAPDPALYDQMLALARDAQADPDSSSRHAYLVTALAAFTLETNRLQVQFRRERENEPFDIDYPDALDFSAVVTESDTSDRKLMFQEAAARRALAILEERDAFAQVEQLLEQPNLANQYLAGLDADGNRLPMVDWMLPELAQFRVYTTAQIARSRLLADAGDGEQAADVLLRVARVPGVLTRQPTLIEHMVGHACSSVIAQEIAHQATRSPISTRTLATLQEASHRLADLGSMELALRGELLSQQDLHNMTHTASGRYIPSAADKYFNGWSSSSASGAPGPLTRLKDITGYYAVSRDTSLRFVEDYLGALIRAINEKDPATRDRILTDWHTRMDTLSPRYRFAWIFMPALGKATSTAAETQNRLTALQTLIAMARYRADHDEWPATIEQLIPDYLSTHPIDPQTGDPIRYRHEPDELPVLERFGG